MSKVCTLLKFVIVQKIYAINRIFLILKIKGKGFREIILSLTAQHYVLTKMQEEIKPNLKVNLAKLGDGRG